MALRESKSAFSDRSAKPRGLQESACTLEDTREFKKNAQLHRQLGMYIGGVGGNRTRVQKHSTDSSTYLVLPFDLILTTRTHTLRQDELPMI